MKIFFTILLFLPLLAMCQTKTVNPSDSLKKYQKLYRRDLDSLKKYAKRPGWNEHYSKLWMKRQAQIKVWADEQLKIDDKKRMGKS
jgi:hypothetical protein